ncbi:MAG: response regulator [bacterium]
MKILVADDDVVTRMLLERSLKKWGYVVISAVDGQTAWELLQQEDAPRIVILDWMMPGYDGIEICQKLNQKNNGSFTYTILLTSKGEKENILIGFNSGAHDFLVKPFDPDELKTRLDVGVRIIEYEETLKEKNKQLECYATQMEDLAEERYRQLAHADRMSTLGILSAGIAHEINNPTTFIAGNLQIFQDFWKEIELNLSQKLKVTKGDKKKLTFILEEMPKMLTDMRSGVDRIVRIVKGLKAYAHRDSGERIFCQINQCIQEAIGLCRNSLNSKIKIELDLKDHLPEIKANAQQLEQIFINFFVNSVDAMEEEEKGILRVVTDKIDGWLKIIIEDTGPGIPVENLTKIWEPFFTTKKVGKGTGLGLPISQKIIENHGGKIRYENRKEGGARFIIELEIDHEDK